MKIWSEHPMAPVVVIVLVNALFCFEMVTCR